MTAEEKHIKKHLSLTKRDMEYRQKFSYTTTLELMESYHKESSKELVEALEGFVNYCYGTEMQETERFKKGVKALENHLK